MSGPGLLAVFSADVLGGSELFSLEFLRTARRRGVSIRALVPGDGPLHQALAPLTERIEVVPVPPALASLSRFEPRIDARGLPQRVRALGDYLPLLGRWLRTLPGVVCCFGFRSQLAVAAVLPLRRPGLWVVHEVVPPGAPATAWRAASRRASCIVTYSAVAASQRALRDRGAQVRPVRFDLDPYARVEEIRQVRTVGLVGDLVELKNHLLAIELAQRLRERGQEVSVLLVGRDLSDQVPRTREYASRVHRAAAETPGVQLIASTPEAMPDAISRLDVLVHLSTVPESFGRVCVEAMAAGRPVVAYDHGAVGDLVDDGRTGLLCPAGDVDAVTRGLLELARDPRRCIEMGRSARSSALERFAERPEQNDTVGDTLADFAIATA